MRFALFSLVGAEADPKVGMLLTRVQGGDVSCVDDQYATLPQLDETAVGVQLHVHDPVRPDSLEKSEAGTTSGRRTP